MRMPKPYSTAVALGLLGVLILLWIHGAFASEGDSPGWLFFGVLAVGALGSILARFRPRGMAWALFATACAQIVAAVIAMISWGQYVEIGLFNLFFVVLWTGSGLLFRRSAER